MLKSTPRKTLSFISCKRKVKTTKKIIACNNIGHTMSQRIKKNFQSSVIPTDKGCQGDAEVKDSKSKMKQLTFACQ